MSIIVPSLRLSRSARPILLPGWDDAPIDRPRRRSAWWRRLLSGAAGLTRLQPGSCCGCTVAFASCSAIPDPLTLTDALGTLTLFDAGSPPVGSNKIWSGCRMISLPSRQVTTPGGTCAAGAKSTQPCLICYNLYCHDGFAPHFHIERVWGVVQDPLAFTYSYYAVSPAPDCTASLGALCVSGAPAPCSGGQTDFSSANADATTYSPSFTISFSSLALNNTFGGTSDPVGGGISISS